MQNSIHLVYKIQKGIFEKEMKDPFSGVSLMATSQDEKIVIVMKFCGWHGGEA